MPKAQYMQTNFTAGELSPRLFGRVDIDRYHNAAELVENCLVYVGGGVDRRPGTRFIAPAKHADKRARLIPYVFNESQSYVIEMGDGYMRVFRPDGTQVQADGEPYQLATPYGEDELDQVEFVQGADTMFLMHPSHPVSRLRRFADDAWAFDEVPWIVMPFAEIGDRLEMTLHLDETSVGEDRTLTAGDEAFLASDVGRQVRAGGGVAVVTAVSSPTEATADIVTDFPANDYGAGEWVLVGTPLTSCKPSIEKPVGSAVTLTLGSAGWRITDVGKWVSLNGGLVQISGVTSDTIADGVIKEEMSSDVSAPAYAWILKGAVWGGYNGHPRTGTLYQQRLWLAGSPAFPQTMWGSRIGEYYNFQIGTNDDDAMSLIVASDRLNPIVHLSQLKIMVALTYGGEFTVAGGNETSITPTNVQISNQSDFGCSRMDPQRIGNELVFVARGRRKVRAMSADKIVSNQYGSPDISILSEHITASGLVAMAFEAEPDPHLWCVREDGQIATCTMDRDQAVIGWSRQVTEGAFESVTVIPDGHRGEQVWAIVRRELASGTVRYVERFEADIMTDCAMVQTDSTGKATWDGLEHLEKRTVTVKADGVHINDQVVRDGAITLERQAQVLEVGLPFTPRIKPLRPAPQDAYGAAQMSRVRVSQVALRFRETTGVLINGSPAFARQTGLGVLDTPPPLVTGDVRLDTLGWEIGDWHLEIEQPHPYPFHLQAVMYMMTVNE